MNKKWFITFMAIALGAFSTPGARADLGDFYFEKVQALSPNYGNVAGTMLNQEGRGDVLIFPYYDVREISGKTQDFYFAIINDDGACGSSSAECHAGVAAEIRFREWDKGEDVLGFSIWLSRGDVWVGELTHNTVLAQPYGARITSPDWVIVNFTASTFTLAKPLANGFDFPTTAYIPQGSSNLMGYFEVIAEERTFDHQVSGTATRLSGVRDAPNSLMGSAYINRAADGSVLAYNAKALANFSRNTTTLFYGFGVSFPNFQNAEDYLDTVEFQLSQKGVIADYDTGNALTGKFSLILTFPTKWCHFCGRPNYTLVDDPSAPVLCGGPGGPTTSGSPWTARNASSIEPIDVTIFDRNENRISPTGVGLPHAVNIIGLYQGTPPALPAAGNRDNVGLSTQTYDSGYIAVNFPNTGSPYDLARFLDYDSFFSSYGGLPVLGLALQEFSNGVVGGWYGDIRDVFYRTEWNP